MRCVVRKIWFLMALIGRLHDKPPMINNNIISDTEALQILKNDLLRRALEKHAPELRDATAEERAEIMARIEQDIQQELRRRREMGQASGPLLY